MPSGKFLLSSFIVLRTASDSSSAFAPGAWAIGIATADSLLSRLRSEYWPAPSSMRATSFSVVTPPSGSVFRTMSPNSSSVIRRPEVVTFELVLGADRRRIGADDAGSDLHVLLANRAHDVACRQAAARDALGIEPHAHRVVARAEQTHFAHARQAREHVAHLQRGVVAQINRVVAAVGGSQVHDHQQVGRGLLRRHADAAHVFRQTRQRLRDAVLHLHLRVVDVGAEAERDRQQHRAVAGRLRGHVEHVLDAVDFLLERRGDGLGDHLRVRARILRAHLHRRRHDLGVLADRQLPYGDGADQEDDDRQHRREDRPVDEEACEFHDGFLLLGGHRRAWTRPARVHPSPRARARRRRRDGRAACR